MNKAKLIEYTKNTSVLGAKLATGQISTEEHNRQMLPLINNFLKENDGWRIKVPFIHS